MCFGAVHWSPVPPARKASSSLKLDSEQTKQAAAQYDAARKRFGKQVCLGPHLETS